MPQRKPRPSSLPFVRGRRRLMNITLPYQWTPRAYQEPIWRYLEHGGTRAVLNWHRRSGKDDVCFRHVSVCAFKRPGNYWYMVPQYEQARKMGWDAINPHSGKKRIDEAFPESIRERTLDNTMTIHFKALPGQSGSTLQFVGADNFRSLVGAPPIGLVFSEMAKTNPSAWAYLMPILEENKGWVIFNSTPEGDNHFKDYCELAASTPGWFYSALTAQQTGVFTAKQLEEIERQLIAIYGTDHGHALYCQEYECSFDAAIPGSIWGDSIRQVEARDGITDFAINPDAPVFTGWDLGRTDSTAIWFYQWHGDVLAVIDYYESSFEEIPEYVEVLQRKRDEYGIHYATHWLPHDARPRRLGMGGKSILQQFNDCAREDAGLGRFAIIQSKLDVQEGIQAARATFKIAKFHKTRCVKGLRALRHYHRQYDDEKKKFEDVPFHDWASHGSDAWRYVSLSWEHAKPKVSAPHWHTQLTASAKKGLTWGEVTQEHFARMRRLREERSFT